MCLMLCKLDSLQGEIIISSNNLYGSPSKLPKNVVHSFYEIVSLRNERNIPQYQTYEGKWWMQGCGHGPSRSSKSCF